MRTAFTAFIVTTLLLAFLGCAGKEKETHTNKQPESIGVAWLENDGTLVLHLRAEGQGKAVGDGLIRYKPDDEAYAKTLKYIGGLKKGATKPVPPWPEGEVKENNRPKQGSP